MREMNESRLASMRFQEYRQIANLWMKKHLKKIELKENMLNHQVEHNSEIAKVRYEIINENMNKLILEKFLAFFHVSLQ